MIFKVFKIDLVKKNQELAASTQDKLLIKEKEFQKMVKDTESRYEERLRGVLAENNILKEVFDKKYSEQDKKDFNSAIRAQLIEEIDRLQTEYNHRIDELTVQNLKLTGDYKKFINL